MGLSRVPDYRPRSAFWLCPPAIAVHSAPVHAMKKVPALTLLFWGMKICATTLGETFGDLLSMTLGVGYALSSLLLIAFFLVTLAGQLAARQYHPALFWAVILSTSTAGTTMSDFMDRTLGVGYAWGATILVTLLVGILIAWRATESSIAVDQVQSRRSEAFYWAAILLSNTLGTALGDFLADSSGLGFAGGALLIGGLLMVVVAAYAFTHLSRVALFWLAFVLTRPLGATMGDALTKPHAQGGMGLGTLGSSAVLAVVLVALVVQQTVVQRRASLSPATRSPKQ